MSFSRVSSPCSSFPSPPPVLAPIAEQESLGMTTAEPTPNVSEEMAYAHAQQIVPPDDSISEVHAVPAQIVEELENQANDPENPNPSSPEARPQRSIIFPIMPFYRRKDGCSKCNIWLGLLFVLFFLLSIALFLVWAITSNGFKNLGSHKNVCNSKECIFTAHRFSSYMDDTIDACENFYRFSCSKFHLLNADQQLNFLDKQGEASKRIAYGLLSADPNTGTKSARFVKSLFETCMNGADRAKNGNSAFLNFLRNFPCGPILSECSDFKPDSYSWERHVGMLNWYAGDGNLVVYGRDVDPQDKSRLILQIRPPNLEPFIDPLRKSLVETVRPSNSEMDALLQVSLQQNLLSDFVLRQISRDPHEVESMLDEIAFFMLQINNRATPFAELSRNTTYMTIGELIQMIPQINFREMMNADLSNIYKWTDSDIIAVQNVDYFVFLGDLAKKTNNRILANYLLTLTGLNLRQYSFDSRSQFSWKDCVDQMLELQPVEKMYVTVMKNFPSNEVKDFMAVLKDDFINTHRQYPLQYLSEINRMSFLVGFPQRITNEYLVWQPFSDLILNQTDYFQSITQTWKAQWSSEMKNIGSYLDNDDAPLYPIIRPTLVYKPHLYSLVLPLSFLQEPISLPGENTPWYNIYGSLGVIVQQMISKIFWTNRDQTTQKQCLDSTYRSFLNTNYRNMNLNNDLENTIEMADGIKSALYGYLKWERDSMNYKEPTLPSYEKYDSIQSLLLSFGTLFCNTDGSQPGSQYEAMLNTATANTQSFSMHFQCTNTSKTFHRRNCV